MSAVGTKLPIRDVRCMVAIGGKADVSGKAHFGSDGPKADEIKKHKKQLFPFGPIYPHWPAVNSQSFNH
jgi:hypothetical protein